MRKIILKTLKYILFLTFGIGIFYYIYKDFDFNTIKQQLNNNFNYWWIIVAMCMTILSHFIRALRWNLVINNDIRSVSLSNSFKSIMSGYFMNLIIPRMGEVTRCATIAKKEKVTFSEALGTVVTERIIDMIMLLSLTLLVILSQTKKLTTFLSQHPDITNRWENITSSNWSIPIGIILISLFGWISYKILISERLKKISIIQNFIQGIISIQKMKNPFLFVIYTIAIWGLYFLMDYVSFFAFDFTNHLSVMAGITVFVFGSYGMVAPVQGGIGPWHFMTVEALALYGIDQSNGLMFALIVHTAITFITFAVGGICTLLITFSKPNSKQIK
ncbi:flippase-like domain-containing protein [Halosquirtibacter laminarini]|uniref:Flippase-like domain-containing protein n=1 Tax=Halosquirtibacter laminarini TaxID=3374600 RepID=A0AC61NFU7_9BACT|nr:flippase-like domain-containing protein [Prolixibacteraceae bacterium]